MAVRPAAPFFFELPTVATAKFWAKVVLWAAIYYVTSALSGVYNKWLVDGTSFAVSPTALTFFHLLVALGSDAVIMHNSNEEVLARSKLASEQRRTVLDVAAAFAPIALFVVLSKLLTYLSYQHGSIALSHTAKASEPIFNVVVAAVVFGEYHSPAVYVSLLPICLGILLASVSELGSHHGFGFAVAAASALTKVLQNIYTKRLMVGARWTFWEVHLYCGGASLCMMVPLMYVTWVYLRHSPYSGSVPLLGLLFDAVLQWASSVSAYVVLSLVSHLTATIINTFKRVVMIASGGLSDPSFRLAPLNVFGVLLATAGIFLYNLVKDSEYLQAQIQMGMGRATQTLGLRVPLPGWLDAWAEKQTGGGGAGGGAETTLNTAEHETVQLSQALFGLRRTLLRWVLTAAPSIAPFVTTLLGGASGRGGGGAGADGPNSATSAGGQHGDLESGAGCRTEGCKEAGSPATASSSSMDASLLAGSGWSSATTVLSRSLRATAAHVGGGGVGGAGRPARGWEPGTAEGSDDCPPSPNVSVREDAAAGGAGAGEADGLLLVAQQAEDREGRDAAVVLGGGMAGGGGRGDAWPFTHTGSGASAASSHTHRDARVMTAPPNSPPPASSPLPPPYMLGLGLDSPLPLPLGRGAGGAVGAHRAGAGRGALEPPATADTAGETRR